MVSISPEQAADVPALPGVIWAVYAMLRRKRWGQEKRAVYRVPTKQAIRGG